MKKHRISYFDVVGRATDGLGDRKVAQAIERLSATYREGRTDFDYSTAEGRAAYLWHILPAHVCDLARLIADRGLHQGRETLRVVGLGSGPGTEVLALLEAISTSRGRGELDELRSLEAVRIERASEWDHAFGALLGPLLEQVTQRDPGLGSEWTFEAGPKGIAWDLTQPPIPTAAAEALAKADLVVAANLLSEVRPRGTDELPSGLRDCLAAVFDALPEGADVLLVDRAGAPGAAARCAAAAELARERWPALEVTGPRERASRCGCSFTRKGKAIYRHVKLPTTRQEDRPVKNCKTLWYHLRLGSQA